MDTRIVRREERNVCEQALKLWGHKAQLDKAIQEAAEHRDRVIVVGAYLSLGVSHIHNRWMAGFNKQAGGMYGSENPLKGLDIRLSEQGLLPDEMVTQWIVDTARGEVQRHSRQQ